MSLFKVDGDKVSHIMSEMIDKEKKLQSIFENNLEELLGIIFLHSEYRTSWGGRIDTLGIDQEGSPCIIEYKKSQDDNVMNQGITYLSWLLDHKDTLKEICSEKKLDIEINWDSPRVLCIAENFNKFDHKPAELWQQRAGVKVELWEYKKYENGILQVELQVESKTSQHQQKKIVRKESEKTIKDRDEMCFMEKHLNKGSPEVQEMFYSLKEKIMALDEDINETPQAKYITYKTSAFKSFVSITIQHTQLKILINIPRGKLKDPQQIAEDQSKVSHHGRYEYSIDLKRREELEYVFGFINQNYELKR